MRDVRQFAVWTEGREVTRELVIAYKTRLEETGRGAQSLNTVLSALNSLFRFLGWEDCRVKTFHIQRRICRPENEELTRAEYEKLVKTAEGNGDRRLSLLLQTVCGTGIRVSELPFITVEAVRKGEAVVNCKGKSRPVFLVKELRKRLLA